MMGSLLDVAVRRAGEGGFDKPVAALAGGAAAALLFLMPVDVLQNLVIDSGLPSLLAAAEPPLGLKARAVLALVAGIVFFASAYGLMRLLGRTPARPARRVEAEVSPEPVPRMRRRDLHPDAPVRAPISAVRDLGHPEGEEGDAPLVLTEFLPELPPEAMAQDDEEQNEEEQELVLSEAEIVEEPAPAPQREIAPEPEASEPAAQPQGDSTIAELLARLERALEKKPGPQWLERPAPPQPQSQPQPQAQPQAQNGPQPVAANEEAAEPMDARLRSALENLKRFAPAQG